MDNSRFIRVVADHIETGQLFRAGILNNDEIATKVRAAATELESLRARMDKQIPIDEVNSLLADRMTVLKAQFIRTNVEAERGRIAEAIWQLSELKSSLAAKVLSLHGQ